MLTRKACRRALLVGLTWGAVTMTVWGAEAPPPSYAVLSLIGDRMTVVWFHQATASNLDRNERQDVPTNDATLDNTALLAADDALKRLQPGAQSTLLASRDPALYQLQDRALDGGGDTAEMLANVKSLLQQSKATRLILVTKHRAEARLQSKTAYLGTGRLTGLGFYVDQERVTANGETGVEAVGFIAPYAYLTVSLIDVSTMTTLRRSVVTESTVVTSAGNKNAMRPWDALTPKQKLEALEEAIRKAIDRAVPEVLAGG